jgi:hypothetical protein
MFRASIRDPAAATALAKGLFGTQDLPGKGDDCLDAAKDQIPALLQKGRRLGFPYVYGQHPMCRPMRRSMCPQRFTSSRDPA